MAGDEANASPDVWTLARWASMELNLASRTPDSLIWRCSRCPSPDRRTRRNLVNEIIELARAGRPIPPLRNINPFPRSSSCAPTRSPSVALALRSSLSRERRLRSTARGTVLLPGSIEVGPLEDAARPTRRRGRQPGPDVRIEGASLDPEISDRLGVGVPALLHVHPRARVNAKVRVHYCGALLLRHRRCRSFRTAPARGTTQCAVRGNPLRSPSAIGSRNRQGAWDGRIAGRRQGRRRRVMWSGFMSGFLSRACEGSPGARAQARLEQQGFESTARLARSAGSSESAERAAPLEAQGNAGGETIGGTDRTGRGITAVRAAALTPTKALTSSESRAPRWAQAVAGASRARSGCGTAARAPWRSRIRFPSTDRCRRCRKLPGCADAKRRATSTTLLHLA